MKGFEHRKYFVLLDFQEDILLIRQFTNYNYLADGESTNACEKPAHDITRVLEYLGMHSKSRLAGTCWTVEGNDC